MIFPKRESLRGSSQTGFNFKSPTVGPPGYLTASSSWPIAAVEKVGAAQIGHTLVVALERGDKNVALLMADLVPNGLPSLATSIL